jgi:hypothetical protein
MENIGGEIPEVRMDFGAPYEERVYAVRWV